MNFDLVRPCADCPFRSDRPGYLRAEFVREVLGGGEGRQFWPAVSFPCHKTIDYEVEGAPVTPPTAQQCAGVMLILHRESRPNDAMQLGQRFGRFDPAKLDSDAPVYESTEAAIKAQRS